VTVSLQPLDESLMERLLAVAVADAAPDEVIPPVDAPPGWSPQRKEFFRTFHRDRFGGLDGRPLRTIMFAILVDEGVVGMIRLSRVDPPGTCETGMWLGRSVRGQGIASTALRLALAHAMAAGVTAVRANTTADNTAAQATLRSAGAILKAAGDRVDAEIDTTA
jgi:RimJ/RimL family protein N-acetyltransferase